MLFKIIIDFLLREEFNGLIKNQSWCLRDIM